LDHVKDVPLCPPPRSALDIGSDAVRGMKREVEQCGLQDITTWCIRSNDNEVIRGLATRPRKFSGCALLNCSVTCSYTKNEMSSYRFEVFRCLDGEVGKSGKRKESDRKECGEHIRCYRLKEGG
jgi:hypothetical protein